VPSCSCRSLNFLSSTAFPGSYVDELGRKTLYDYNTSDQWGDGAAVDMLQDRVAFLKDIRFEPVFPLHLTANR
jgi:hypothetical protein